MLNRINNMVTISQINGLMLKPCYVSCSSCISLKGAFCIDWTTWLPPSPNKRSYASFSPTYDAKKLCFWSNCLFATPSQDNLPKSNWFCIGISIQCPQLMMHKPCFDPITRSPPHSKIIYPNQNDSDTNLSTQYPNLWCKTLFWSYCLFTTPLQDNLPKSNCFWHRFQAHNNPNLWCKNFGSV